MRRLYVALALTLAFVPQAFAWNHFGHMVVAAAAYEKLTPAAKAHIKQLLQLNPDYKQWVSEGGGDTDQVAFIVAATWPDEIKFESGYRNDGEHPKDAAAAAQNTGYSDHLQHRYWHFVDEPFSPDHTPLIQPESPNALTQIVTFRKALSSDAGNDVKSYDLVWLEHLVGDVHQPLHATSRFTSAQPKGDEGGNNVSLCDKPRCREELHAAWDDILGTSKKADDAIKYLKRLPSPDSRAVGNDNPEAWIKESFALAQSKVYVSPIGEGPGPYKLDAAYRAQARDVAQQQVALAGARLAKLLNASFN